MDVQIINEFTICNHSSEDPSALSIQLIWGPRLSDNLVEPNVQNADALLLGGDQRRRIIFLFKSKFIVIV